MYLTIGLYFFEDYSTIVIPSLIGLLVIENCSETIGFFCTFMIFVRNLQVLEIIYLVLH